jgi:centromere/kinetochore protein ZW10
MSTQVSAEKLGDAILQSVEHGAFPQDEHVASATVPSSALPKLLEIVGKAKEDTKVRAINCYIKIRANVWS